MARQRVARDGRLTLPRVDAKEIPLPNVKGPILSKVLMIMPTRVAWRDA